MKSRISIIVMLTFLQCSTKMKVNENEVSRNKPAILPRDTAHLQVVSESVQSMYTVCVYAVWGIGGLKNEAQRNVKLDHLQTVPRYRTKLRKYF